MSVVNKKTKIKSKKSIINHILSYMMIDDIDDLNFKDKITNQIEIWVDDNKIHDETQLYGPYYIGNLDCIYDVRIKNQLMNINNKEGYRKLIRQEDPIELFSNNIKFLKTVSLLEISFKDRNKSSRNKNRESNITLIFSTDKL